MCVIIRYLCVFSGWRSIGTEERNVAYRSTVIVDRDGRVRWSQAGDRQMTRSGAEIRRVLELIQRLRNSS
jgi:alkyl hydroperoxide reductase subunit AhpC